MPHDPSTILVIGASGFVGRHLARALLADGRAVRCAARDTARLQDLAELGGDVVRVDVLDAPAVDLALTGVDAVYVCLHTLSPQGAGSSGKDFMGVEKAGLANLARSCAAHGVRRLVYLTSIGTAPDAPSAWLRERWQVERSLFDSALDVSVLRPGMIVGRGGTGFEAVARGARGPVAVGLGGGGQKMRTIAVDDLVYYLLGVLEEPRSFGHRYDVGSDDVLTTDEMIDITAASQGRRRPVKVHVPRVALSLLAPLLERVTRLPRGAFTGLVDSLQVDMSGDPHPIRVLLSRPPQPYRQAAEQALAHRAP